MSVPIPIMFKTIKAAPAYIIYPNGAVVSKLTGRALAPFLRNGYKTVNLRVNGEGVHFYVHRLVAEAFIPNPDGLPVINHIDKDKLNNNSSNLEWCTTAHNQEHSCAKTYTLCTPDGERLEVFNLKKFCKDVGLSYDAMHLVVNNKQKRHKGWSLWED